MFIERCTLATSKGNTEHLSISLHDLICRPWFPSGAMAFMPLYTDTFDFSGMKLDNAGLEEILRTLTQSSSVCLRRLNLSDNRWEGAGAGKLLREFLQHPAASSLVSLDISENNLSVECAYELARGLKSHGKLQTLRMGACSFDDSATNSTRTKENVWNVLVDSFLGNPSLIELELTVGEASEEMPSSIDATGTMAMTRLLQEHGNLQYLTIVQSPDFLSPELPKSVNEALLKAMGRANSKLSSLTLEGCGIHDETMVMFCDYVLRKPHSSLKYLDLLSNDLGKQGYDHLCQTLPVCKSLCSLSLEGTWMPDWDTFTTAVEKNTSLEYLRVLDAPADVLAAVNQCTTRNYWMHKVPRVLQDANDNVQGYAMLKLAQSPQGKHALFHLLTQHGPPQSNKRRRSA